MSQCCAAARPPTSGVARRRAPLRNHPFVTRSGLLTLVGRVVPAWPVAAFQTVSAHLARLSVQQDTGRPEKRHGRLLGSSRSAASTAMPTSPVWRLPETQASAAQACAMQQDHRPPAGDRRCMQNVCRRETTRGQKVVRDGRSNRHLPGSAALRPIRRDLPERPEVTGVKRSQVQILSADHVSAGQSQQGLLQDLGAWRTGVRHSPCAPSRSNWPRRYHRAGPMNAAAGRPSHCVTRMTSARSAKVAVRRPVSLLAVQSSSSASFAQVSFRSWRSSLSAACSSLRFQRSRCSGPAVGSCVSPTSAVGPVKKSSGGRPSHRSMNSEYWQDVAPRVSRREMAPPQSG